MNNRVMCENCEKRLGSRCTCGEKVLCKNCNSTHLCGSGLEF